MLWTTMTLLCLMTAAPGQANDAAPINKRNFKIPIVIAADQRAQIKEMLLFVSADQGQTWNQSAKKTPTDEYFSFFAPADGVYWFVVAVVDMQGRQEPPDINTVAPNQKILVDTLKPDVQIQSADRQGDEVVVNWAVKEDHPDANSLRLEYRPADAGPTAFWTQVQVLPGLTGQSRFRPGVPGPLSVRLEMKDVAGNSGSTIRDLPAAAQAAAPPVGPGAPVAVLPSGPAPTAVPPAPVAAQPAPAAAPGTSPLSQPNPVDPAARADDRWPTDPYRSASVNQAVYPPVDPDGRRVLNSNDPRMQPVSPANFSTPGPGLRGLLPQVQVVNTRQIGLQYEVTESGASGVGRIEVYMTRDDGLTWIKGAESGDPRAPIQVALPEEGVAYGLRLVLTSGAGVSRGAPMRGEVPEMRVELDTLPPVVKLYEPHPDPMLRDRLTIQWSAADRNLTATPITLEWSADPSKGWETIATQLPNTGSYAWQIPTNLPARVHLRVTAVDTAGNRGVVATQEPTLIDQVRPAGRLVGIATLVHSQPQPAPPAQLQPVAPPQPPPAYPAPQAMQQPPPVPTEHTFLPPPQ